MQSFINLVNRINPSYSNFECLRTIQLNLGNMCNLHCAHCHVAASPAGTRIMGREVLMTVIDFLRRKTGLTLDITGGCPEMNPHFRFLIEETAELSVRRMVRTNLTIFCESGMEWLPRYYRDNRLVVIASLPCYLEENVDRQRGKGVFDKCIKALKTLNELGYGSSCELNLVYNPGGAYLPGPQEELENSYKEYLLDNYGIVFNKLFTLTNAPIGRFKDYLKQKGDYERYLTLLADNFNPDTASHIMCRTTISVDWQGILYNCDFNQAVGLPISAPDGSTLHIKDLDKAAIKGSKLFLGRHCYCCTAGEGSSCTGVLAA